ncbi:hypothetical protein RIR_jg14377.t1 [Rhizophagus irregularis DAOM 181602=DAOM 197198]|nr:hypothetical protein RIR_jg14377.t1 [Rhizophagus irregularis DAOM 181602=DAOM 197198]
MKIKKEIGRGRDGSFKLLWETFWRFFCISCDGQAFGRVKFPTTGQAFGCVKFSTATHVILERYDGRGIVAKI